MSVLLGITDSKDITIIQAILLLKNRGIHISQVKYIRTAGDDIDESARLFFFSEGISYQTHNSSNNGVLKDENDYLLQEDELMKWYIHSTGDVENVFVFIGGGHKLHSLALQKCAFLFGATDVFHMFISVARGEEPKSVEEIQHAIDNKNILYASLGKEPGWPALRKLTAKGVLEGQIIRTMVERIGSRTVGQINEYPFESISLLPGIAIKWLYTPLTEDDYNFVLELPKVELHCHLGGYAAFGDELDEIRSSADSTVQIGPKKEIEVPNGWPKPDKPFELEKYMILGDNNGSYILKNIGCLNKQVDMLYYHLLAQNIGYAEIRCSPYNYASEEYSGLEILQFIQKRFDDNMTSAKASREFWCHVNLIVIATRTDTGDHRKIQDHLELAKIAEARSHQEGRCKIVGVDLAGFEYPGTRASYYSDLFVPIHKKGMALTIHAGENDDSDAIWDAVFKLNTRRIGHGLHLYQDRNLLRSVINRRIGIEMCPYANYQIKGYFPMKGNTKKYPLIDYLRKGAAVTINTDNIGISNASLSENFLLAASMNPELSRMDVLQLIRNGLEQAFIDTQLRNKLIQVYNERIFNLVFNHEMLIK